MKKTTLIISIITILSFLINFNLTAKANWQKPRESKELKNLRLRISSKSCNINNENSSDNCINNNKIPLKNWIYMGTYENGEEITHWYISDVRRMTNSYNNAIYNYLGITFPSKYEESFTVDFSSAGTFDRVDCSSNSPIWYFRNESGKWEKDFEKEYKSFKEFKSSDYFYEEQGIEYNLEMYNSMKETFSINRFICRQL